MVVVVRFKYEHYENRYGRRAYWTVPVRKAASGAPASRKPAFRLRKKTISFTGIFVEPRAKYLMIYVG